ncbi:MAG: TatD family hydrolase [Lachnospiraceae bacterium]
MIFESHAHYDDEQFDKDREELLNSMLENKIGTIVNVGATLASCDAAVKLAKDYPFIYAAVGVHPDEVGTLDEAAFAHIENLCGNKKVVAIGEIGLDYYWENEPRMIQKKWFIKQLQLAKKWNLPVLIHSREAAADTMDIMKEHAAGLTGVIHCYSYSVEMAKEYVDMGYGIGIGGVVTFKNSKKLKEVVKSIPLTSLLLETDCPYLAPEPNRGKRNSSLNLPYVAEEIAKLKECTYEEVVVQTEKNAKQLFQINETTIHCNEQKKY